jgi:rare lipoprotein A
MYVPVPPVPAAVGIAAPSSQSAALGPALPKAGWLSATSTRSSTTLAVRSSTLNVLDGHLATVTGTLRVGRAPGGVAGRVVALQALSGWTWSTLAVARTGGTGIFRLRVVPRRIGSERVRVRFAGEQGLRASARMLGRLNVYRAVQASWYGGGGGLACGGSLTSSTMGVANRTLPCGTIVTLKLGWRTVSVPVIDRGPYVEGREFDLTEATKQALGFGSTGEVWSTR